MTSTFSEEAQPCFSPQTASDLISDLKENKATLNGVMINISYAESFDKSKVNRVITKNLLRDILVRHSELIVLILKKGVSHSNPRQFVKDAGIDAVVYQLLVFFHKANLLQFEESDTASLWNISRCPSIKLVTTIDYLLTNLTSEVITLDTGLKTRSEADRRERLSTQGDTFFGSW